MRLLGALVAILALVLITMAALGSFGPTETARAVPTPPRAATPSAASASPPPSGDRGTTAPPPRAALRQPAQPAHAAGGCDDAATTRGGRHGLDRGALRHLSGRGQRHARGAYRGRRRRRDPWRDLRGAHAERAGVGEAPPPLIQETTALDLEKAAALLRERRISSTALTEACLARIAAVEPRVNAFVTVTADIARAQAAEAEREIAAGRYRGTLHGIPVAVKDRFATKGIRTTAGSRTLKDWVPEDDATVVRKLREAGAVLLGKLGMHEFAYGISSVNPHFGDVRNPWDTTKIPGGSSGGSAVAVVMAEA